MLWNMVFLMLSTLAFLSKTTGLVSRGWVLMFHPIGLMSLILIERRVAALLEAGLISGRIARSRALLVGSAARITAFAKHAAWDSTIEVSDHLELPPRASSTAGSEVEALDEALARASARARSLHVETVVLLLDWSESALIDRCTAAFLQLPVSVHVLAHDTLRHYPSVRVADVAGRVTLRLTDLPLTPWQEASKRVLDVTLAGAGLLLLAPLLAVAAFLIKLDSPGPVFFRQRRRGFNHREFQIWKLRTMTTLDDGDNIEQARKGDPRVTRIGRLLRRYNIDELPQLINVLRGEMSLVGPRPHAVAHDRLYETCIEEYPRRLNMLPGITGWAQVNGYRGATETPATMRKRVEYDVFYIQNWSLSFDLYILALTVLSPRAYRNAH
jgi:Undecaprenyl-phosphate glucose phosphotransferase